MTNDRLTFVDHRGRIQLELVGNYATVGIVSLGLDVLCSALGCS